MTRARGNVLQNALADYLAEWWPNAESVGSGRQGTDIIKTPGIVWENKTAANFKRDFRPRAWVEQAKGHAKPSQTVGGIVLPPELPFVVYFPAGIGAENVANTLSMTPLHVQVRLLREAGYC